jgi:hypothetical protein
MAMGSTQPLREMSAMNFPGAEKRLARRADNLTTICEPMSENVGTTPCSPKGLHSLYKENFTFTFYHRTRHVLI